MARRTLLITFIATYLLPLGSIIRYLIRLRDDRFWSIALLHQRAPPLRLEVEPSPFMGEILRSRYNDQGVLLRNQSSSAYHMYLIHPPILVLASLGFASIRLIPVLKLAIVFPLAVILCYLASYCVLQRIRLNKLKGLH